MSIVILEYLRVRNVPISEMKLEEDKNVDVISKTKKNMMKDRDLFDKV
jgi:hypothetical protein